MSTLTTIKIITDHALQPLPPRPFLRFYGKVLSYSSVSGALTIQELPAFMVTVSLDGSSVQSQPSTCELPTLKLVVPPTGLTFSNEIIRQRQIVSVLGHLEQDMTVTLYSIQAMQNQQLFDLGFEDDRYSTTVLQKVELAKYIAVNS